MIALTSPASTATHSACAAMPPLPGAHQIFSTRGLCLSFHTSACSRPPPPSTRIFIRHPSRTTARNDRRPLWGCQPARVTPRFPESLPDGLVPTEARKCPPCLSIGHALLQWPVTPSPEGPLDSAELFLRGCKMLIPLRHENMEGRRWPVVTFALIALNVAIFLGTHWTIEAQEPARLEVRMHLLVLAATHPDLKMPDDVEKFVNEVQTKAPRLPGSSWPRPIARPR